MLKKFKSCLKNATSFSLLTVKYGILLSFIVLFFAVVHLSTNSGTEPHKALVSLEIIKIGLIIFAESFVLGAITDILAKRIEKNNSR